MSCLGQCLAIDCIKRAAFIITLRVKLKVCHQSSSLMMIGHLLGAKEAGRENQCFLSTYSVPGLYIFSSDTI